MSTDFKPGTVIPIEFGTYTRDGVLTSDVRAVGQAGVPPTFRIRRLSTRALYNVPAGMVTVNEVPGRHAILLDTSQDVTFFVDGEAYEAQFLDGEVNDGTAYRPVSYQPVGQDARFSMGFDSSGIVRATAVISSAGQVVTVTAQDRLVVSIVGVDHSIYPAGSDPYGDLEIHFQPGAANAGHTRRIEASEITGTNVTLILNRPLPLTVGTNDPLVILPGLKFGPEGTVGTVLSVTDNASFTASLRGVDHSGYAAGTELYANQVVDFSYGVNKFRGRAIRTGRVNGANVDFTFQLPFSDLPVVGERFRLSPLPGIGEAGIAHITWNPAGDASDDYHCDWTQNNVLLRPDDIGGGSRTRIDIANANTGEVIQGNAIMTEVATGHYVFEETTNRIPPGISATVVCKGRLSGVDYEWPRTLPNVAASA